MGAVVAVVVLAGIQLEAARSAAVVGVYGGSLASIGVVGWGKMERAMGALYRTWRQGSSMLEVATRGDRGHVVRQLWARRARGGVREVGNGPDKWVSQGRERKRERPGRARLWLGHGLAGLRVRGSSGLGHRLGLGLFSLFYFLFLFIISVLI